MTWWGERPIFDVVDAHLRALGDVIVDPIAGEADPMVPDDIDDPFGD